MKKFIRNMVKRIVRKLFGSKLIQFCFEEMIKGGRMGGVISDSVIVSSRVLNVDLDDFVSRQDYDFDSFISDDDYDLDDFITCREFNPEDYDFDSFVTKQEFDPDDYVTQSHLQDEMDGFDPDDYVRCDDFDPDDYVRCQDCDPDDFVHTSDFKPDEFVTKKDIQNFEAKEIGMESFNALQDVRCSVQDMAQALDKLAADYVQRKQERIEQQ